jgi:hypothetical protein
MANSWIEELVGQFRCLHMSDVVDEDHGVQIVISRRDLARRSCKTCLSFCEVAAEHDIKDGGTEAQAIDKAKKSATMLCWSPGLRMTSPPLGMTVVAAMAS